MNIGLIRMRYNPFGGAEVFLSRFTDELLKKGHTCHIFANKWDKEKSGVWSQKSEVGSQIPNLIFHKVRLLGPSFLRPLSFAINSYFAVKKTELDVVISFDRTFNQDIYRAGDGCHKEWLMQRMKAEDGRLKAEGKSKIIMFIKKSSTFLNPLHLTLLYLEKKLFQSKRLKIVVANSERGKREIIRHYGLPEKKICVIYNGIVIHAFDLDKKKDIRLVYRGKLNLKDEIMILFVGSGFERKGLRYLIEALGHLKKQISLENLPQKMPFINTGQIAPFKLIVIGKGDTKKYRLIAERNGVEAEIEFTGPDKDVIGCYYAADIFVLPSIYEPFSNACLEAMAGGLPVVTSRINGVSEILTHGKDGMIIDDPVNPLEIAEKIMPLLDLETRVAIGMAARKTVGNYTIEKNVNEFLKCMEQIKCSKVV